MVEESDIGEHLFRMNGLEFLNGFELDDHKVLDEKIDTKAVVKMHALKFEADFFLALDVQATTRKFLREDRFINRLQ